MKKYKKPLSIAICALGLISLAGCGVTTKDNIIIEYNYVAPNGKVETKEITADDVFDRYLEQNPSNHAAAFYNAMNEIQIKLSFLDENGTMHHRLAEVNRETDIDVQEEQDTADENGEDWEDHLEGLGYDDPNMDVAEKEAAYWADRQYAIMQEKIEDEYYDRFNVWQESTAADEDYTLQQKYNLVWGENGYLKTRMPYNVKHLLIQIGSSTDEFTRSEVTEDGVTKLYNAVNALINVDPSNNITFNSVAKIWTDDSGITNNPNGYLMDLSTSFVNEFKLGVYTYEVLLDIQDSSATDAATTNAETKAAYADRVSSGTYTNKSSFNIPGYTTSGFTSGSVAEYLSNLGAAFIPYGALVEMNTYKSITTTSSGQTVNDGSAAYYPRNIIFNKYFNRHNIAFLTDEDVKYTDGATEEEFVNNGGTKITFTDGTTGVSDLKNGKYDTGSQYAGLNTQNFHPLTINGDTKNVLCDENGNPIMMVLNATSSGGIHFIVVERSALDEVKKEVRYDGKTERDVTLAEYFAPENPLNSNSLVSKNGTLGPDYNSDFPGVSEDGYPKMTYVYSDTITNLNGYSDIIGASGGLEENYKGYQESSGSSSTGIKDMVIIDWLNESANVSVSVTSTNDKINDLIARYEEQIEVSYSNGVADTLKTAWDSLYNTIVNQERERETGLIPETCALHFGDSNYYGTNGICYYSSSADQSTSSGSSSSTTD